MVSCLNSYFDAIFTNYRVVVVLFEHFLQQRFDIHSKAIAIYNGILCLSTYCP